MNDQLTREERIALLLSINSERNKFGPKLTYAQRCEVLALRHIGVRREVLAKMYGVDRRTITHIYNPDSPHYKNVRELEIGLGQEQFRNKYVSSELLDKALSHSQVENRNNKFANKKQGINMV